MLFAGGSLEATIVTVQSLPVHFPLGKPAFFMYDAASAGSPWVFWTKSNSEPCGPATPPAWSNPGIPGGMKCVAMAPTSGPPRVFTSASRSELAITALRTLRSSNGGLVVFSATYRLPPPAVSVSWSGKFWTASLITSGSELKSPFTRALPFRIFFPAETVSEKPSWMSTLSR